MVVHGPQDGELVRGPCLEEPHRPVLAHDHLGRQLGRARQRHQERLLGPASGDDVQASDAEFRRVREPPAQIRRQLIARHRALRGRGRRVRRGLLVEHGLSQLVDALEEASLHVDELATVRSFGRVCGARPVRDDVRRQAPELDEPLGGDGVGRRRVADDIVLVEQRLELGAELLAQRRRPLLFDDELGQNPVDQSRGILRRRARELGREDGGDGVAQLAVVQRPVVGGLPHDGVTRTARCRWSWPRRARSRAEPRRYGR